MPPFMNLQSMALENARQGLYERLDVFFFRLASGKEAGQARLDRPDRAPPE